MWCYEDASKEKDYACVRQAPFVLNLTFKYTDITHSTLIFTARQHSLLCRALY